MNVTLDPELEQYVADQVRAGRFESPDELLSAAVAQLRGGDAAAADFPPGALDRLLAEGEADVARGDVLTAADARDHFRRRAADAAAPSDAAAEPGR